MQERLEKRWSAAGWGGVALALALAAAAAGYGRPQGEATTSGSEERGGKQVAAPVAATVENALVRDSIRTLPAAGSIDGSTPSGIPTTVADSATGQGEPGAAGVRAFIDPETGKLTANPTRAQLQRLALQARAATLSRSTAGLQPFPLSRGGRGLNLHGRFQSAMRVERAADGSFHMTCGDASHDEEAHSHLGAAGAADLQRSTVTSTTAPEQ